MEFCCLSAGANHFSVEERCSLFCRIMKMFIYFSGQFPDLSLLDPPQNGLDRGPHLKHLHPKLVKFIQSVVEIESHLLISKSESIVYFLIMIGGLPSNPNVRSL
ncbi:unnamed protein product [Heterobilharzia americana]|nr:unnamed protein product [Heterobilharzia americana]